MDSQAQREAAPQCIEAARQTAMAELDEVAEWLDAPCCATVKLDGTNVGIDGQGQIVGRNYVVPPEERFYQKVDVHALLNDPGAGAGGEVKESRSFALPQQSQVGPRLSLWTAS